jgi:hypothetical protein
MNPYKKLLALLPQRPLLVGEIIGIDGDIATIQEVGGGVSIARGAVGYSVGGDVYFRDDVIESAAPSLPDEIIDV